MNAINLQDKFAQFSSHWSPKIIGELNQQHVKLAKIQGEFPWHAHAEEDELFFVVQGEMEIHFRDRVTQLKTGEMLIVPKGVEHSPRAETECWIMLFEPASTLNTGDQRNNFTAENLDWV